MTPYSDIYKRFTTKVQDPFLEHLYNKSVTDFEEYLYGFLLGSVDEFDVCKQDLYDRNEDLKQFNISLSSREQEILAELMKVKWMEKEVNNINEMKLRLSNTDFKYYAESNNLLSKKALKNEMQEQVNNLITRYSYQNFKVNG